MNMTKRKEDIVMLKNSIEEEKLSKLRAKKMWDTREIELFDVGTIKGLREIHAYLFEEVFEFAGELRKVNISKGNFRFVAVLYLDEALKQIDKMSEETFDQIVDKYVEMNIVHPFREGNGRSTRIWLDLILKKNLKQCVDWSKINKADYLSAMERSPINTLEISVLLKKNLTGDINNREVFMKGIDASYVYEDMDEYSVETLW